MSHFEGDLRVAPDSRSVVVASRWNPRIVDAMVDAARRTFADHGVLAESLDVVRVPGAWEIPLAAARAARRGYRGIVALGSCDIPVGVGARGGRLARVASKLARSKALKRIARAALDKAARMNPAQASGALVIARTALDAAKRLDREARADREPDDAPPPPEVEAEEYEYDAP